MTPFAGLISLNSTPIGRDQIELMSNNLVAFKPDDKKIFGDSKARFVQLARENPPRPSFKKGGSDYPPFLKGGRGDFIFLCDARLDNYLDLKAELGLSNQTCSDADLVWAAYQKWGKACVSKLYGDFVFAVWDKQSNKLFCARDQIGQRLIYYFYLPGQVFAFATNVKALLDLGLIKRKVNLEKAADFLLLSSPNPEQTFYKSVFRLPAACTLELSNNQLKINKPYWSLGQIQKVRYQKDSDYLEAFLEVFETAVKTRLRSNFPIGAQLSGGFDSSSVAALAARHLDKLYTFSAFPPLGYEGPSRPNWNLDDRQDVKQITDMHPNMESEIVTSENSDLFTGLYESFPWLDVPCVNPCNRIWIHDILEAAKKKNIRVMLSGQAGNGTISWAGKTLKQQVGYWGRKFLGLHPDLWQQFRGVSLISDEWAKKREPIFKANSRIQFDMRHLMIINGIVPEALSYYQSLRSIHGIEFRDPTQDHRLIEFCLGLPNSQFARKGKNRMLVRRGMKGLLPESVLWKETRGEQLGAWPLMISRSIERMKRELNCGLGASSSSRGAEGDVAIQDSMDCFSAKALRNDENSKFCKSSNSPTAELIDLNQLKALLENWPSADLKSPQEVFKYRSKMLRGHFTATFMDWVSR